MGKNPKECFTRSLRVPGKGKVRLVISFENPELTGTYAVLVTNRTNWSAKKILTTYIQRWPIETFYQDSKGHLGLDEYRIRSAEAMFKNWVSGLRGLFTCASSLFTDFTDTRNWEISLTPDQNHWGSLSPTGAGVD